MCGAYQLLIVVAYLILSINVYLESQAFGPFSIGYGKVGPTEIRIVLIALNTALILGGGLEFQVGELDLTVFDAIGLGIAGGMIAMLIGRAWKNLRELARAEPSASRGIDGAVISQIAGWLSADPLTTANRSLECRLRSRRENESPEAKVKSLSKETRKASSLEGYE